MITKQKERINIRTILIIRALVKSIYIYIYIHISSSSSLRVLMYLHSTF